MKLYRFTASNAQQAIFTVNEALGPDALVYSTRKVSGGVEVLAGLAIVNENIPKDLNVTEMNVAYDNNQLAVDIQDASFDHKILESVREQMELMNSSISALASSLATIQSTVAERMKRRSFLNIDWNKQIHLSKLWRIVKYARKSSSSLS